MNREEKRKHYRTEYSEYMKIIFGKMRSSLKRFKYI
jgi:hypothetical protein